MNVYRRVLVPIDGSPTSLRGLREATRLAINQHARLRLLHVVDETVMLGAMGAGVDPAPLFAAFVKEGRALLERIRRKTAKRGIRVETEIREAIAKPAADAILSEANKWRADLIVMGTHGRRGIRRLVLGSDAEQVLRLARMPVLLIRARTRRS